MRRIWFGIGFSIIPFLVLLLGYLNVHPELYRSIPSNFSNPKSYPITSIAFSDEEEKKDPPIQFVSSNHRGLNVWTEVKTISSFWDLWNSPDSYLEYEWEYKVKNLTDKKRSITVWYRLEDENENELSESSQTEVAEPGEMITIKHINRINYNKLPLVKGSGWSVSSSESN